MSSLEVLTIWVLLHEIQATLTPSKLVTISNPAQRNHDRPLPCSKCSVVLTETAGQAAETSPCGLVLQVDAERAADSGL